MTTKREYLTTLGLAKPGRGRFSREGLAALAKAEAEGVTFSDAPAGAATPPAGLPVEASPKE